MTDTVRRTGPDANHEEQSRWQLAAPSSPAHPKPSSHESPPVDPDQVCEAHLGLRNQPGDDGRRLPWNTNNNDVGIDLHRRRSVIVRRTQSGETLETVRINNDRESLAAELAKAGEHPEVILEATYGWYWAADVLEECGATVHLSHPLGNNWGNRRMKNDERDATDLVDLFRMGRLAEAWSPHQSSERSASSSATEASSFTCAQTSRPRSIRCWPRRVWRCP